MTYDLMLNMSKSGIKPRIKVSQYDNEIPQLRITLFDQNQSYAIPSGATVYISGTKKDNTGFQYECTVNDNIITAPITNQMTVFSGDVECEINIVTLGGQKSSENFILEVEKSALQDDVVISETDLPIIEHLPQMIQEMKDEVEIAHNWANYGDESEEPSANNNSKHWSDVSGDNAELSHQWATYGSSSENPSATNNAKYWSGVAQQYAQGGLHYSGSITFANIPTTGMNVGDMYNIEDDFTTDSRFQEGSGISVKAGSNIAWNPNDKWDVLALGGGGSLTELNDVNISSPTNGQVLGYDNASGKWKNVNPPSGGGAEISAIVNVYGAKNLNSYPYYHTTNINYGVTFTDNGDGSIKVNGTATGDDAYFTLHTRDITQPNPLVLPSGTYKVSGCPLGGSDSTYYLQIGRIYNGAYQLLGIDTGNGCEFTINETSNIGFSVLIKQNTTVDNLTFYPMLRDARITDDTYVPYAMTNRELTENTVKTISTTISTSSDSNAIGGFFGSILKTTLGIPSTATIISVKVLDASGYPGVGSSGNLGVVISTMHSGDASVTISYI